MLFFFVIRVLATSKDREWGLNGEMWYVRVAKLILKILQLANFLFWSFVEKP